jgi:hypothetical protein
MLRIVGAILGGNAVIGVLGFITGRILPAVIPGFQTMTTVPLSYYVALIVTNTLYSIGGGYVCAAIAGASAHKATLAMIIIGEIGGVIGAVWFRFYLPPFYTLAILLLLPLAIWLGFGLRSEGKRNA